MTLALLSGGMDSTTLIAHVKATAAVFVDYGQRHIRERESAQQVAHYYGIPLHELNLTSYGASVHSALTSPGMAVPHGHYAAAMMSRTVVPGRNAVMLSAAAGIAASGGYDRIAVAVHAGDHPIYPDCRPEFLSALGAALQLGYAVELLAPFVAMSKADIARRAYELEAPLHLSWSCYEGGDRHCGRCGTCVERAEAFALAGVVDPTDYVDPLFWRQAASG